MVTSLRDFPKVPFYLLEPVLLEFDIHLHAFYCAGDFIADADFGIVKVVSCLKDLHQAFIDIDAFTQAGIFVMISPSKPDCFARSISDLMDCRRFRTCSIAS